MRRDRRLAIITWFGGLALIVQAMLPLFLAIEFRLVAIEAPYLTATDEAICGPGHEGAPGSTQHDHRHLAGCPICVTLAAAQAATTPASAELPPPQAVATRLAAGNLPAAFASSVGSRPYQARAPPRTV